MNNKPVNRDDKSAACSGNGDSNDNQCPFRCTTTATTTTTTSSKSSTPFTGYSNGGNSRQSSVGQSCPIDINNTQELNKSLKNKLNAAEISLCPVMWKSLSTDSSKDLAAITSSTPTDSLRPETPDEDKLDLRHLSLALMKLLYPKNDDVYEIMRKNFQTRNYLVWENSSKTFQSKYSLNKLTDDKKKNQLNEVVHDTAKTETNATSSILSETTQQHINGSTGCAVKQNNNEAKDSNNSSSSDLLTNSELNNDYFSFGQLEQLTKHVCKQMNLTWEEIVVECGEQYAQQCLDCDSKSLKFVGENLIEFLVNVENIQSIAYQEINGLPGVNQYWPPSQADLLPISVFVNHSESQVVITYNIQQPICRFVACFLSGLYRKLARALFGIIIKVNVEIGSDQYKFVIENYRTGHNLVQNDSFVSRYKQSLLNKTQDLLMSVSTFSRVFPFHFICDQNLRFIQYGSGLHKVFGEQSKLNTHISNVFTIVQPNVGFFFESIRHRTNLAFILRIRDNILNENFRGLGLKGQIIESVESKCLLFLGSPVVNGLQSLTSRGLFLSDIPIHDATRDIILVEEQSRAQESLKRRMDKLKENIQKANQAVEIERRKNVDLLNLIFPANVARQLWLAQCVEARQYNDVTMLFSDIVGFTSICSTASPMAIINMLNELYTQFDVFCGEVDVYKTETIGDAYCVASGIHRQNKYHAVLATFMGLKMISAVKNFRPRDINVEKFQMRVGLHSGPCLTGIVGVKMPRYCLFGANVTLANKFESQSEAQRINISPTTYRLLCQYQGFKFTSRNASCLPKECPADMERLSNFVDDYRHPELDPNLDLATHIAKALEDILPKELLAVR